METDSLVSAAPSEGLSLPPPAPLGATSMAVDGVSLLLLPPSRCSMDFCHPVFVYGSRTTHCDVMCTTNTTRPAGPFPSADPLHAPNQPLCLLPYEVAELLAISDTHTGTFRTPLELQMATNFRIRKNRQFSKERRDFLERLRVSQRSAYPGSVRT